MDIHICTNVSEYVSRSADIYSAYVRDNPIRARLERFLFDDSGFVFILPRVRVDDRYLPAGKGNGKWFRLADDTADVLAFGPYRPELLYGTSEYNASLRRISAGYIISVAISPPEQIEGKMYGRISRTNLDSVCTDEKLAGGITVCLVKV